MKSSVDLEEASLTAALYQKHDVVLLELKQRNFTGWTDFRFPFRLYLSLEYRMRGEEFFLNLFIQQFQLISRTLVTIFVTSIKLQF